MLLFVTLRICDWFAIAAKIIFILRILIIIWATSRRNKKKDSTRTWKWRLHLRIFSRKFTRTCQLNIIFIYTQVHYTYVCMSNFTTNCQIYWFEHLIDRILREKKLITYRIGELWKSHGPVTNDKVLVTKQIFYSHRL